MGQKFGVCKITKNTFIQQFIKIDSKDRIVIK